MTDVSQDARPLEWYKPTDHPQDTERALWMAHGIGGRYSIQGDLEKFIVWHAADEFTFTTCDTVEACKEWAESDWQAAVKRILKSPKERGEDNCWVPAHIRSTIADRDTEAMRLLREARDELIKQCWSWPDRHKLVDRIDTLTSAAQDGVS